MLQSMTGYGKVAAEFQGKKLVVELKVLNSKQIDIQSRVAGVYRDKDIEFRNIITSHLVRGKVDFSMYIDDAGSALSVAHINNAAVANYYAQIKETCESVGEPIPANIMQMIMCLPEVMRSETAEISTAEQDFVKETLIKACSEVEQFRKQEGKVLEQVFHDKIDAIRTLLADIEPYEAERLLRVRTKLEDALETISTKITIDNNRLEQEMIFYIEKFDVNEEKSRLRNHLNYFIETMENEPAAGKKLGFIAQEMGREINTLGSKSSHAEMQKIVVKMKDELEQIKEQVLNAL